MAKSARIKPTNKPIREYYEVLQSYSDHEVKHEGALETAFSNLLAETGKSHGWTLIPKQKLRVNNANIFPDGTMRDFFFARRGFWEAKDTHDDLDAEIAKKIAKGYPTINTIFEDTRQAVLYQGGRERNRFDLKKPQQIADLLNDFYAYTEPEIHDFQEAVEEFKTRVPELAAGLIAILTEAHKSNKKFQAAFDGFFTVCQQTLNPNISRAAVDEMLVQHLLTERLFRKIFDNQEFIHRNVIAAEIEKVIEALVSLSFNRDQFLKSLDRFYRAIEDAAHTLEDFNEKQHFLNTVYERFFQGYSIKLADTHGIVYTPQEIVDFMCASVAVVLHKEFGLSLGSKGVNILDPCTGTGNFIVNLMRRIPKKDLPRVYKEQLFANEVMLLPYYIAAMNIEHAFWELVGRYETFEGLCFVDTLELDEHKGTLSFMTEANAARVERQKLTPITIIIGNPPYNVGQLNENDNNKNRKYPIIEQRIKETYAKASGATLKAQLYDPYVKFFRWATDRLGDEGVVCLVSNNSFVDQITFDGMRKHLMQDFTRIYHLHLEGNVRQNPKLSGTAYNVFGIQVGVGITVAVKSKRHQLPVLFFQRVEKNLRRADKLNWLTRLEDLNGLEWQELAPDSRNTWLLSGYGDEFANYLAIGDRATRSAKSSERNVIFETYSVGMKSNRDDTVYDFRQDALLTRIEEFIDNYNGEVDRHKRKGQGKSVDDFLDYSKVKWSSTLKAHLLRGTLAKMDASKIVTALYRPFSKRYLYYDDILTDRPGSFREFLPRSSELGNPMITLTGLGSEKPFMTLVAGLVPDFHLVGAGCSTQCFPLYVYDEAGSNRRENISDWSLEQFRTHYVDKRITKGDIFYYIYGILHHPGYRVKFADNLKRELPRVPFAPDFKAFATDGKKLADLHLDYEKLEPYPLKWIESRDLPLSCRVEDKMRLNKDKTAVVINPSLTLADIPLEAFNYRLGNRSAFDWVIDQYQLSQDKRSGIESDPNREDDPEYIVRLVGQVVRVSVETVNVVNGLPKDFGGTDS